LAVLTNKVILKEKVYVDYNIGRLKQKGKGIYIGDFFNGFRHGKG
jgi:hypothetical protein